MSGEIIKAGETKYSQLFDQSVVDILADRAKPDTEIPLLLGFVLRARLEHLFLWAVSRRVVRWSW